MTGVKEGDRVRVESFEVNVLKIEDNSAGKTTVWFTDGSGIGTTCVVLADRCTVIVPPVKVGDIVTADNVGQLPQGSVIAHPLSPAWTLDSRGWCRYGTDPAPADGFCTGAYIVLRIGGAS